MKPDQLSQAGKFATDPLAWVGYFWPDITLYDKQAQAIVSVAENDETFVHAANQMGKTFLAALVALWMFSTRSPAIVVTSSSSERQLKEILWQEMAGLRAIAKHDLDSGFRFQVLEAKAIDEDGEEVPKHYMVGRVARQVENFQGHHLPEDKVPRVLFIMDEASGIEDIFYDAADSQAHRILVIGNPLNTTNFFYRHCAKGAVPHVNEDAPGLMRKVIHISAEDSPNVQAGRAWEESDMPGEPPTIVEGVVSYEEFIERDANWDRFKKRTRLYGKFPDDSEDKLISTEMLDDCEALFALLPQFRPGPYWLGVDVAGGGRDDTCYTLIDKWGIVEQKCKNTPNTMEICGDIIRYIKDFGLIPSCVCVDAGGGGKQLGDRLWEQDYEVRIIHFGAAANDNKAYVNKRAEMYGWVAQYMAADRRVIDEELDGDGKPTGKRIVRAGFAIQPNSPKLREDLNVLPASRDSEGRLKLPPKDVPTESNKRSLKSILGRSPDRGDSLALAAEARGPVAKVPMPRRHLGLIATTAGQHNRTVREKSKDEDAPDRKTSILDHVLGPGRAAKYRKR